jgi:NAD(P)-dependent dehydrogenase (short-subunit alcohol dehydrogenase family)
MTDTSLRNNNDNSNRKSKVAIITGSDRGIGRAIALVYINQS